MKTYLDKIHAGLADILASELGLRMITFEKVCESPIEVALGLSIYMLDRVNPVPYQPLIFCTQDEMEHFAGSRMLVPQFKEEGKRIDFLLRDPPVEIFIECDGHDFHERTKQQAARDRRRDREVQQTGRPILRFTGSEIYADPVGCAGEVFDILGDLHMYRHIDGLKK